MRFALVCGVSALALTTAAFAVNSPISTLRNIELFAAGSAPASVTAKSASILEKQSALTGSNYAVVSGAINQQGMLNSYIRLFNGNAAVAANFSVTIVDEATGVSLGTTSYSIPPMASKQYFLPTIMGAIAPTAAPGGTYSIYLQSPEPTAGYQHVTFNAGTALFENASICKTLLSQVTLANSNSIVLVNMNTNVVEAFGYPMKFTLHNYADTPKTYTVSVYDAGTGVKKGQINIPTQANTTYSFPFVTGIQTAPGVNWTASAAADEQFANIVITDSSSTTAPNAVAGAIIDTSGKLGANAFSNMSTACAVNAVATSTAGGGTTTPTDPGGGFGGGGIY